MDAAAIEFAELHDKVLRDNRARGGLYDSPRFLFFVLYI